MVTQKLFHMALLLLTVIYSSNPPNKALIRTSFPSLNFVLG